MTGTEKKPQQVQIKLRGAFVDQETARRLVPRLTYKQRRVFEVARAVYVDQDGRLTFTLPEQLEGHYQTALLDVEERIPRWGEVKLEQLKELLRIDEPSPQRALATGMLRLAAPELFEIVRVLYEWRRYPCTSPCDAEQPCRACETRAALAGFEKKLSEVLPP